MLIRADRTAPAAIELAVGKLLAAFLVVALPADFGRGFHVEKLSDGTVYHVNLDGERSTCDCPGHTYRGRCKPVDGLVALIKAGKL